ncbi:Retrovirus-related Pol polyprotein from transposon [Nosema granulosis]|uniref:Retrovirus-related Pol polyprotein from transposon n=1 Tax=Nosema granulosis TaxID=83296 RepID=A0A9P6H212_9MICR|nr:Retrovirus-related Pol polyprotein from transposon [Nosema granulosis]
MFYPNQQLATAQEKINIQFRNERIDDPQIFLGDMMEYIELAGSDENRCKWVFKTALKEEGEAWYRASGVGLSFGELVEAFKKRFLSRTMIKVNIDRISRTKYQGGSLLYYLDLIAGIARRGGIPEDVLVAFAISGIPQHIADMTTLNAKEGLNWNELYSICERLQVSRGFNEGISDSVGQDTGVNRIMRQNTHRRHVICFLCKKPGHRVDSCYLNPKYKNTKPREQRRNVREVESEIQEYRLEEEEPEENKSFRSYRVFDINNIYRGPWLTAKIEDTDRTLKCLVDSGADVNLIRPEKILDIVKLSKTNITLRTAKNSRMRTLGRCNLKLKIEGQALEGDFIVTEDIKTGCILGLPLLNKYKAELKFGYKFECKIGADKKESKLGSHRIFTKGDTPVMAPLYKLGPEKEKLASEFIDKYLKEGIIRPSKSPWRSPVTIAPKKEEKGRFCIDYRRLNDITVRDAYPMPRVEQNTLVRWMRNQGIIRLIWTRGIWRRQLLRVGRGCLSLQKCPLD